MVKKTFFKSQKKRKRDNVSIPSKSHKKERCENNDKKIKSIIDNIREQNKPSDSPRAGQSNVSEYTPNHDTNDGVLNTKQTDTTFTLGNSSFFCNNKNNTNNTSIISNLDDPIDSRNVTSIHKLYEEPKVDDNFYLVVKNKDIEDSLYMPTMVSFKDNKTLPICTDVLCWWCKHSFQTVPLGMPLEWVPSCVNIYKNIIPGSNTREDTFVPIKRKLTIQKASDMLQNWEECKECIESSNSSNECECNKILPPDIELNNYYKTEGIFCSFNCVLSYYNDISSNKTYYKYNNTYTLIIHMFNLLNNRKSYPPPKIHPAPDWRFLKEYGGGMTIDEFRNSFNKYTFKNKLYTFRPMCDLTFVKLQF
jgi:hypothetical protein